jgi:4-amino-4-deoxy-L-arabinose transferase-like glycosyltransferase
MNPLTPGKINPAAILFGLSFLLALVSSFLIARHIPGVPDWISGLPRGIFVVAMPLSAAALFFGTAAFVPFRPIKPFISRILLLALPSVVAISIGWHFQNEIPDTTKMIVTFYGFVVATFFAISLTKKFLPTLHSPAATGSCVRKWFTIQGPARIAIVIALSGIFFGFAAHDLGKSANVDEALWLHDRIPKYWNALEALEFRKTSISDKPGITVALVSGAGLLSEPDPKSWKDTTGNPAGTESFFFSFRIPIVVFAALLLPLFYFLLERLVGRTRGMFAFALIALSPTTIGMTRIINPDALLWMFVPLSLIAFLVHIKRRHIGYLLLSGVLLGLALLTKYVANILFVFAFGLIFLEYVFRGKDESFLPYLRRSLLSYGLWTFVAIAMFFVLFPATWLRPGKLLDATIFSQAFESTAVLFLSLLSIVLADRIFNKARISEAIMLRIRSHRFGIASAIAVSWVALIAFVTGNTWAGMIPYNFQTMLSAPKTIFTETGFFGIFSTNFYPLLFGVTPLVFFSLFLTPLFLLGKRSLGIATGKSVLYGIIFIILYSFGSAINGVGAITRYQIILFPIAAMISGIGIGTFVKFLEAHFITRYGGRTAKYVFPIVFGIVIAVSVFTLAKTPFPLSYASSLLPDRYHTDVKDMGSGSYEAAMFLNALPDARSLTVWTDKNGVCTFFVGRCLSNFDWKRYQAEQFDYVVVSSGRESRTTGRVRIAIDDGRKDMIRFDEYYGKTDGWEWELLINDRTGQSVRIFPTPENGEWKSLRDGTFRANIITDIDHCSVRNPISKDALRNFIGRSDASSVDLSISLGDNVSHRLGKCSETAEVDLPFVINELNSAKAQTRWVLGNHDIASDQDSYKFWLDLTGQSKTYYTIPVDGVRVIVLDTVTGGEPLETPCSSNPDCADPARAEIIDMVRNTEKRDRGMILDRQRDWLASVLKESEEDRVVVFSDHPLFPFSSEKKDYDIRNGAKVRSILESSGKEIVAISGEAHLWHEEERNGIRYFIVDQFRANGGSWGLFTWNRESGPRFERITGGATATK